MAYTEDQKNKILLNLKTEENEKKGKKTPWWMILFVVLIAIAGFLCYGFFGFAIAGGICRMFGISYWWILIIVN